MCKRVMIGLFTLSVVALVWTDANAGCPGNVCASWIHGSGYPTGLVTVNVSDFEANSAACPFVTTGGGGGDGDPTVLLRLLGKVGTNCGFGGNESCDIEGVGVCGASTNKNVTIPGPLIVSSGDGFGQTDGSTNSANFRFQLDTSQQTAVCGSEMFIAFFARRGFYEACVNGTNCNRQDCTADLGGIKKGDVRVLHCKQL